MRVINSGDVKKLFEDNTDPGEFFDFDESERSPCWEAKIDRAEGKLLFLIDNEEVLSAPYPISPHTELTFEDLVYFIQLLRNGKYGQLKKEIYK